MTLKWGQSYQNHIKSSVCPNNLPMPIWWNSAQWFKRYRGYIENVTYLSPVTLKIRSRSPKSNQFLSLSQWYIHASLEKFSRLVQETIHIRGYKKWDADRICTETSMYPSPPGEGGIKTMKLLVLLFISYALICILNKANNLQPLSSCQTTSEWRHTDVSWTWWCRSRTSFRSHVSVRWLPSPKP